MTITSTEANRMMNFATYIYLRNSDSYSVENAEKFAREMFKEFCAIEGITDVEVEDEDDEDNLELGFNPYEGGYDYDC